MQPKPQEGLKQFDFTYVKVNSLYRNRIADGTNILDYLILDKGASGQNTIGIGKSPSDIVQLEIGNMYLPKKLTELVTTTSDSLIFHRIYILVTQFDSEYFSSPQGFRYHFEFQLTQDPQNDTQLIATPVNDRFTFPNAMRFYNQLTFNFFTYKPYIFEQNIYEVYANYSVGFLRFSKIDGSDHQLTGFDIVSIQNFDVPGVLSLDSKNASTYRDNYYRINVVDSVNFEVPIVLEPAIANSINRPGDPTLGYYKAPVTCNALPSISPTIIQSQIQHGLQNGDLITIQSVSNIALNTIIRQFAVTVTSPTTFSIQYDSSSIIDPFQVVVTEFPRISPNRTNTLFIFIQSRKVEFQLQMKSLSTSANNSTITVS